MQIVQAKGNANQNFMVVIIVGLLFLAAAIFIGYQQARLLKGIETTGTVVKFIRDNSARRDKNNDPIMNQYRAQIRKVRRAQQFN